MKSFQRLVRAGAAAILLSLGTAAPAQPPAAPPSLADALKANRHALLVGPGVFSGDGAPILDKAVASARFVAVGEDHLTREIPAFVGALCERMGRDLSGLVLEVGPRALAAIEPALRSTDRLRRMGAFNRAYPSGIAFLSSRADNDMAAHCLAVRPGLRLIGIDQEFLGSAGLILDRILATRLTPAARAEIARLRAEERRRAAAAARSGDPRDLFLVAMGEEDALARAEAALRHGGTPAAAAMLADLRKSREIYLMGGNASNRLRARLLKSNLAAQLPARGKVILKMGDWHIYRGYNPLNNRDLGNWLAERADSEGTPSLHILILGAKGVHALYGGYARPLRREPFTMAEDRDYRWLQAAIDASGPGAGGGWTLFDLRKVRDARPAGLDVAWRRVLDGFDLLVLVPELSPSEEISG